MLNKNQIRFPTRTSLKTLFYQHGFTLSSITIILLLLWISVAAPTFLIGEAQRAQHIEIYTGSSTFSTDAMSDDDDFSPLSKGKSMTSRKDIWLRIKVPETYFKTHQTITLFSTANTNLTEMDAYHVVDRKWQHISSCSSLKEDRECLSHHFKSFLNFQINSSPNQWIYLHLFKEDQILYHQFFFHPQHQYGEISESVMYMLAFLQGIFFLFFICGLIFSIPLRDPSLFCFGIFFLGLLVSSQFGRSTPISSNFNTNLISHGVVSMMYILLTLKTTLMISVFDLRNKLQWLFYVFVSMMMLSALLAVLIWIPQTEAIVVRLQLPLFSLNLSLICSLVFLILSKQLTASLDMCLAIFIGAFSTILWSLNRGGLVELSWITDLYSLIGEALGGLVLLALIFKQVKNIISERYMVQFRLQESRMAKSLLRALSHDLSNTTQVIISNSHLIEMHSAAGKPVDKFLARIVSSAEVQSKIIKHFKNNYVVRGSTQVQVKAVPVLQSLNQALDVYAESIANKSIQVQINCNDPNLHVLAEASILTFQVFANILGNAVKYSPTKGIIHIAVDITSPKVVTVSFKDQGGGIKPEILEKIFDERLKISPFERTEEGTGLGLLIVQDFIKSFSGEVEVQNYSQPLNPEGTIVRVHLKKANAPAQSSNFA